MALCFRAVLSSDTLFDVKCSILTLSLSRVCVAVCVTCITGAISSWGTSLMFSSSPSSRHRTLDSPTTSSSLTWRTSTVWVNQNPTHTFIRWAQLYDIHMHHKRFFLPWIIRSKCYIQNTSEIVIHYVAEIKYNFGRIGRIFCLAKANFIASILFILYTNK